MSAKTTVQWAPIPLAYSHSSAAGSIRAMRAHNPADARGRGAEQRKCTYCGALLGLLCRTYDGRLSIYHLDRMWPDRIDETHYADTTDSDDW